MAKDNLPIGTIMPYAGETVSLNNNNWKICDGDSVYKSHYPILWSVLGNRWGKHEVIGADVKFSLPDLRGVFLRGVNADRTDKFKDPDVELRTAVTDDKRNETGSFQLSDVGQHQHYINQTTEANKDEAGPRDNVGPITHDPAAIYKSVSLLPVPTEQNPHNETRPSNAYVHYIIKVKDE
ncbi:Microcystin-dependent protein [Pedobacter steynii]|uniref:Microcystin-dependent protein n=1 Tax=Pedobacter steynii TaxID=430522 RepID=A0A1H0KC46_9SPHI|nr:tail fiber protein [Pedobacter steynii]NQX43252.1 tail fiber protein [Pedobacter steynii]SDO53426.1 Microcystin-dependent protein [Pedobacter steynii]